MPESERSRPVRASLRGKGRSILIGGHIDPPLDEDDLAPQPEFPSSLVPPQEFAADRPLFEAPGPSIGAIQSPNDVEDAPDLVEPREGGLVYEPAAEPPPEAADDRFSDTIDDPFGVATPRPNTDVWLPQPRPTDPEILAQLVADANVMELWKQIESLHEELINSVRGDRYDTDTHLKELRDASALLLEKRENYDEARAIYTRVRADLNRQRKVEADIAFHRPRLLKYYLAWGAVWTVVALTGQGLIERTGLFPAAGVPIVFYPVMFGVLGALVSGYFTLERHTTHLRDFDPLHVSWYVFNPPLGAVMGLLMLLLYAIVNQDVLQPGTAEPMEQAVVWLLCAVGGMNQHAVLRHMFRLLDRLASGGS